MHKTKRIAIDIVGILLLISALLFGWLPGPGGIPLLLAGLGLLSINHAWAKRILDHVKKYGFNIRDRIFIDRPLWHAIYDLVSIILIVAAIYLLNTYTRNLTLSFGIFLLFLGAGLFLGNRKRLDKITYKFKKHKPK